MDKKGITKEQNILVDRINELCRKKGYTYYTLSYKASIPITTLMHIIKGESENPGIITVMKICDALEVSLKEFFDTEDFENVIKEMDEDK